MIRSASKSLAFFFLICSFSSKSIFRFTYIYADLNLVELPDEPRFVFIRELKVLALVLEVFELHSQALVFLS